MFGQILLIHFCLCLQADLFPGALVYFGSDMKTGLFELLSLFYLVDS